MADVNSGLGKGKLKPIRIVVETLVDDGLTNAQMSNAREIIHRLDPERFHVTTFVQKDPDPRVRCRPNTRLIQLPSHKQTASILREFLFGEHDVLFYLKASPASRWYMKLKSFCKGQRVTIGTIESQTNWRSEPTITPENIALLENTVLRCDYLFSNSNAVKRSLETEYGLCSDIVPTGVDTKFFTPDWCRTANTRVRVLFVGSLRPFKGPRTVAAAAERFPRADFVIIGDGILASELSHHASRLPNLRVAGSLSPSAVRQQYRQSDIFFFPSRWEGSPKVLMEAAACGLPVIARKDYEPETVIDNKTGYLVGEDDELLEGLDRLVSSPELRRNFGRGGRAHIEKFDWDRVTRQWEEIFLRLASKQGAQA